MRMRDMARYALAGAVVLGLACARNTEEDGGGFEEARARADSMADSLRMQADTNKPTPADTLSDRARADSASDTTRFEAADPN